MGRHDDLIYLRHISDSISAIEEFTNRGGRELFDKDRAIQNAVIKELEIIGEACRNLSENFKRAHHTIPWGDIIGARDKLVHDYMGVDLDRVWLMAVQDVPELKEKVKVILENEGS